MTIDTATAVELDGLIATATGLDLPSGWVDVVVAASTDQRIWVDTDAGNLQGFLLLVDLPASETSLPGWWVGSFWADRAVDDPPHIGWDLISAALADLSVEYGSFVGAPMGSLGAPWIARPTNSIAASYTAPGFIGYYEISTAFTILGKSGAETRATLWWAPNGIDASWTPTP